MRSSENKKKIFIWIFALVCVLLLFNYRTLRDIIRKRKKLNVLENELAAKKTENELLKKRLELLKKDPDILEREVRKRVGLVKPGEIKYKFVD
ncbi:MAG: Cell division protein FtsB [Elusimicrobia bacterium ADurb.Bin231]|nr:MAG: Cell division protein FtsB [Elusimicrobia bacterium ADurb.Bin231]